MSALHIEFVCLGEEGDFFFVFKMYATVSTDGESLRRICVKRYLFKYIEM